MTRPEAMAFCERWLPAWTGNQPDQLIEFYADDAAYRDPACPQGLKGRAELLGYFRKLLARNPSWKWRQQEVFSGEQGFFLKWKAEIPLQGKLIALEGLDIVDVSDSRIQRNEVYFDPSPLRG